MVVSFTSNILFFVDLCRIAYPYDLHFATVKIVEDG